MSQSDNGGWTIATLKEHQAEVDAMQDRLLQERDRRYAEVNVEKEKALKIKEEADKAALGLAREIQTYKDEKANELREQISSERGNYATKDDVTAMGEKFELAMKPVADFMASQRGRTTGIASSWGYLIGAVALVGFFLEWFLR